MAILPQSSPRDDVTSGDTLVYYLFGDPIILLREKGIKQVTQED